MNVIVCYKIPFFFFKNLHELKSLIHFWAEEIRSFGGDLLWIHSSVGHKIAPGLSQLSRSQIGCKANERKTFLIVIISTYKWAGITAGKNVTLPNLIVIKHRHSQKPIEQITVSNKEPVSGLLYRHDSLL